MHENTIKIGGARCRDRTYDIRLVRAVEHSEINHLGRQNRIETGHIKWLRSTNVAHGVAA